MAGDGEGIVANSTVNSVAPTDGRDVIVAGTTCNRGVIADLDNKIIAHISRKVIPVARGEDAVVAIFTRDRVLAAKDGNMVTAGTAENAGTAAVRINIIVAGATGNIAIGSERDKNVRCVATGHGDVVPKMYPGRAVPLMTVGHRILINFVRSGPERGRTDGHAVNRRDNVAGGSNNVVHDIGDGAHARIHAPVGGGIVIEGRLLDYRPGAANLGQGVTDQTDAVIGNGRDAIGEVL